MKLQDRNRDRVGRIPLFLTKALHFPHFLDFDVLVFAYCMLKNDAFEAQNTSMNFNFADSDSGVGKILPPLTFFRRSH